MTKTFYFHTNIHATFNCDKATLKLINRMGWKIISRKELGTVEGTVKIEVYIPEEDMDIYTLAFDDYD